jgi:branched-chain amino acid transport system permease protein
LGLTLPDTPNRLKRLLADGSGLGALASRRRTLEAVVCGIAMALVYFLWAGSDHYRLALLVLGLAYAILGIGIYLPLVLGARLSVSYNAYFAAGAYAVGIIASRSHLPVILAIPAGIVGAVLVAGIVAYACRGLSGYHLAVATIAVANVADRLLIDQPGLTGGSTGIGNIPTLNVLGVQLDARWMIAIGLVVVWLVAVAANRLRDSVWGFALRLQRDAPVAVESCGASVEALRMAAVCVGAGIASLAGLLLAYVNHFIIPESFGFAIVFTVIFIPIVGGSSTAWGSLVGAAFVLWLNSFFQLGSASGGLIFGAGTLAILILAPGGILGVLYSAGEWRRRRPSAAT